MALQAEHGRCLAYEELEYTRGKLALKGSEEMKRLVFVFLVVYAIERILETFWKREKVKGEIIAFYTLPLLVGAHVVIYLVTFWEWVRLGDDEVIWWISLAGMLMVLASVAGRNWAIKTLGSYHSIHVETRQDHELIQCGPYRFVRNPYYLSNMVEVIGLPLASHAWFAMFISGFVYIPVLGFRMMVEEKALESKFQGPFAAYKRQVPRILPKLF